MKTILKRLFHFHKMKPFKYLDNRLVAGYCVKCGCIKTGNPVYYDGSYYQNIFYGIDAVKFIDDNIAYVKSIQERINGLTKLKEQGLLTDDGLSEMKLSISGLLNQYETVEEYEKIKSYINL